MLKQKVAYNGHILYFIATISIDLTILAVNFVICAMLKCIHGIQFHFNYEANILIKCFLSMYVVFCVLSMPYILQIPDLKVLGLVEILRKSSHHQESHESVQAALGSFPGGQCQAQYGRTAL